MNTYAARLFGTVVGVMVIMGVISGCSQGFSRTGAGTQSNPPSGTQPAGPTSTPAVTGPTSKSDVAYRQKSIQAEVSGSNVSVPVAAVAQYGNTNFAVSTPGGNMSFMAYRLDGKTYIRADICPPCGSRSFTLQKGKLTCDSCGTVFNGTTGAGMSGPCIKFPKASVAYVINGPRIAMTMSDLAAAFQDTITRKG